MKISTTIFRFIKNEDYAAAIKMVKDAGFDAYDLALNDLFKTEECVFNGDDYRQTAQKLREFADGIGIKCNQAHAPFPSSYADDERTENAFKGIVRSMEIAAVCGAEYIVVHPKKHLPYRTHKEELIKQNISFYKSLVPYCEKFGIKIAIENMFGREPYSPDKVIIVDSVCSHPEDFCELFNALPKEHFVACVDIGHTVLTNESITRMITSLGHDRVKVIHLHDNSLTVDNHTIPFLGKIPFEEVISALRAIDYDGDLTLETINFDNKFPPELTPAVLKFEAQIARYLADRI